jgi:hypothetical protein
MAINIKPSHKGLFHKDLGKKPGAKITEKDIQRGKNSSSPAERKRAVFAENARHWNHKASGGSVCGFSNY